MFTEEYDSNLTFKALGVAVFMVATLREIWFCFGFLNEDQFIFICKNHTKSASYMELT
jgi:hypothetical protein